MSPLKNDIIFRSAPPSESESLDDVEASERLGMAAGVGELVTGCPAAPPLERASSWEKKR